VSTKPLAQIFYDSTGLIQVGVEQTTAGDDEIPTPIATVPVGTPFSYTLNYINNQLSISVNGATPVTLDTYTLGGLPVYFKAGAYGQTTSPVDLHIFDLRITHN
jgi:Alginate lyase